MTNDEQEHARYAYVRTESYNLMVILSEAILRLEKRKHADQWLLSELSIAHGKAVEFNMFMVTLSDWTPAEAALEAMQTPCVWRVKAPAHFVGHMDDKPLEMILVATSCGKELGVQLPPPYCAYCGHPVEVQP